MSGGIPGEQTILPLRDDPPVGPGRQAVDQGVDGAEHREGPRRAHRVAGGAGELKERQHFGDHGIGRRRVDARGDQGQEKHQQDLADGSKVVRFCTSWATTEAEKDQLIRDIRAL